MDITIDQLRQIMPASMRASSFLGPLNAAMREFGIDTAQRQGMFLANVGAESGQLSTLVENLNYSADRIRMIGNASPAGSRWRSLVPRAADLTGNPERMGNAVYCNRMGNGDEASGEGFLYRGRGLLQTTGKTNYMALMMALGIDCAVPGLRDPWCWASAGEVGPAGGKPESRGSAGGEKPRGRKQSFEGAVRGRQGSHEERIRCETF